MFFGREYSCKLREFVRSATIVGLFAIALALSCLVAPSEAFAVPGVQGGASVGLNAAGDVDTDANAIDSTAVSSIQLGELPYLNITTQATRAKRPTDIVFIVDTTGSMGSYIYKVKSNLIAFVKRLKELGVNPRMALVEYRDVFVDGKESTKIYHFGESMGLWTYDTNAMIEKLNDLSVDGGGDTPETPTHALSKFLSKASFKKGSDRFVFLLTDADYKTSDYGSSGSVASMSSCISKLKKKSAHAIVVSKYSYRSTYYSLFNDTGGRFVDIDSYSYSTMLDSTATWIGDRVLESYKIPEAKTEVGKCYYTGNEVKPKVVVRCNGKRLKYGRDYVIVYKSNTKAGRGTAVIYARGNYVGNKSITFTIQRADIDKVSATTNPVVYNGSKWKPLPSSVYYKGHYLRLGTDYKIVKYGKNCNAGRHAYYKIRGMGNFKGTKTVRFRIKRAPISSAHAAVKSVTYTGSPRKPKPTVTFHGVTLKLGEDYSIVGYSDNVDAGRRATVTLKGKGNFKGTMKVRFTVKRAKLKKASASVKSVTYTGGHQRPKVKLAYKGRSLEKGRDFTVKGYSNNVNAGKHAVVTLKGRGNFRGSKRVEFTIKRAPVGEVEASVGAVTYDGSAQTPGLASATFNGKELKAGRDYRIVGYAKNVNAGKRAKLTIRGMGNFKGTKTVRFRIKRATLRKVKASVSRVTYNGDERCPKLASATFNGKELKAGRDYRITKYANNVNAGKRAVMTLKGKGNFKGVRKVRFTIRKARLKGAEVSAKSVVYNGSPRKTKLTSVTFGGMKLKLGRDYRIDGYANNVNAGDKAIVKIAGKGNYRGIKSAEFTIKKADFRKAKISVKPVSYTGSKVIPSVKVRCHGSDLEQGIDYKLTCKNNVHVGTASATIIGKRNYSGKQTVKFAIVPAEITKAKVVVDKQVYTGSAVKPKPASITLAGRRLTAGVDYKIVSYANNVHVGIETASMVIKGMGGYRGTLTVPFTIDKASSSSGSLRVAVPSGIA